MDEQNNNQGHSIIQMTGQQWKYNMRYFGLFLAPIIWGVGYLYFKDVFDFLKFISYLTIIAFFVISWISIRCPNCGMRWHWHSVNKIGFAKSHEWMTSLQDCPSCNFKP